MEVWHLIALLLYIIVTTYSIINLVRASKTSANVNLLTSIVVFMHIILFCLSIIGGIIHLVSIVDFSWLHYKLI